MPDGLQISRGQKYEEYIQRLKERIEVNRGAVRRVYRVASSAREIRTGEQSGVLDASGDGK